MVAPLVEQVMDTEMELPKLCAAGLKTGVATCGAMTYLAVATELEAPPEPKALALTVVVEAMRMGGP
jgi:hypothetical protein